MKLKPNFGTRNIVAYMLALNFLCHWASVIWCQFYTEYVWPCSSNVCPIWFMEYYAIVVFGAKRESVYMRARRWTKFKSQNIRNRKLRKPINGKMLVFVLMFLCDPVRDWTNFVEKKRTVSPPECCSFEFNRWISRSFEFTSQLCCWYVTLLLLVLLYYQIEFEAADDVIEWHVCWMTYKLRLRLCALSVYLC